MKKLAFALVAFLLMAGAAAAAMTQPDPVSPARNEKTSATPTFIWSKVPDATWYYLFICERDDHSQRYTTWIKGTTSYAIPDSKALKLPVAYEWWVCPWNTKEAYGPWSMKGEFQAGRIKYFSVRPSDFVRSSTVGDTVLTRHDRITHHGGRGYSEVSAPIHLPHGARILEATSYWSDKNTTTDISILLERYEQQTGSGGRMMAYLNSTGASGTGSTTAKEPAMGDTVIDNRTYGYTMRIILRANGDGNTHDFYGAVIKYVE